MAFNLYEIAFKHRYECKQCSEKHPCKICINVALNLYEIAFKYRYECKHCSEKHPCKICISVNLYEIAFKYKDECKDCSAKHPCKISISVAFIFTISLLDRYECKYCIVQQNHYNHSDR